MIRHYRNNQNAQRLIAPPTAQGHPQGFSQIQILHMSHKTAFNIQNTIHKNKQKTFKQM